MTKNGLTNILEEAASAGLPRILRHQTAIKYREACMEYERLLTKPTREQRGQYLLYTLEQNEHGAIKAREYIRRRSRQY